MTRARSPVMPKMTSTSALAGVVTPALARARVAGLGSSRVSAVMRATLPTSVQWCSSVVLASSAASQMPGASSWWAALIAARPRTLA